MITKVSNSVVSKKTMLDLVVGVQQHYESPCFILAPPCCGQNELIEQVLVSRSLQQYHVIPEDGTLKQIEVEDSCHKLACKAEELTLVGPLPWLSDEAAEQFSAELDRLIEEGKQVLVLCSVQNDRYGNLQSDRLKVTLNELKASGFFSASLYSQSLSAFLDEYLPLQIRLAAVLTTVLGRTSLNELAQLGFKISSDIPELLTTLSPLFETDVNKELLFSEEVGLSGLAEPIIKTLIEHVQESELLEEMSAVTTIVANLSIELLKQGKLERSHEVLDIAESLYVAHRQVTSRPQLRTREQEHVLSLGLFGEFRAYYDGKQLKNQHLARAKVRRLLAFLALNHKRIVSRDMLVEYLWPHLDFDHALNNLYSSWSMLGKGLGTGNQGEFSFLQRRGELYQINSQSVKCDTHLFEDLARAILLGQHEIDEQIENLHSMEKLYRDCLVADVSPDSFLVAKSQMFRSLMVDSVLAITRQLKSAGELDKALFYARAAYSLDESREDVYLELMSSQNMAGQRTSAMRTYFSCKQYLSDELGILPSRSTTALYQDLLLDSCS